VTWEELAAGLDPAAFDIRTVPVRLDAMKADPWAGYDTARTTLADAVLAAVPAPHLP
jgi:DNA primase